MTGYIIRPRHNQEIPAVRTNTRGVMVTPVFDSPEDASEWLYDRGHSPMWQKHFIIEEIQWTQRTASKKSHRKSDQSASA